jgi:hypothetical protein
MWPTRIVVNERPTHRCGGVSVSAHTSPYWTSTKRQNHLDCLRRCTYCGPNIWWKTLLLGRWRLWLAWPSRHTVHAKRWGRMPILTNAENDSSSQELGREGSFLRKSAYSCGIEIWPSIFLGCWSLWPTRSPRHLDIPSRWRWLSILTNSKMCQCIEATQVNSCQLWRCPYDGSH